MKKQRGFRRAIVSIFAGMLALNVAHAEKTILTIHSYQETLPWVIEQNSSFQKALGDQFTYETLYLDSKALPESETVKRVDSAIDVFNELQPAAVYVTDDNAFRLVTQKLPLHIPVFFSGVNGNIRTDYPWIVPRKNTFGILERPLIKRAVLQFKLMLDIEIKKALVLIGMSATSKAFFEHDLGGREHFDIWGQISVDVDRSGSLEYWQEAATEAKGNGYDIILVAGNYALTDKSGKHADALELASWLASNASVPVFTIHEHQIGEKMSIGGMVVDGSAMGREAGRMARKVLIDQIEIKNPIKTLDVGKHIFSRSGLRRHNLSYRQNSDLQVKIVP